MPKYPFLGNYKKLDKNNFITLVSELKKRATRNVNNLDSEKEKYYDGIDIKIEKEKLNFLITEISKKISIKNSHNMRVNLGVDLTEVKANAIRYYKQLVNDYVIDPIIKTEILNFLNDKNQTDDLMISEIADRVDDVIPDEHNDKIVSNELFFVPANIILTKIDDLILIAHEEFKDQYLENLGNMMNSYKSKYEYSYDDDITESIYNQETNEIINNLKQNKTLDGKILTDIEINQYEQDLILANKLFGNPKIDLDSMVQDKVDLEKALSRDLAKSAKPKLNEMGISTNVVKNEFDQKLGPYIEIEDGKEEDFKVLKNAFDFKYSNETKEGLKLILNKLHEFGYDKDGIAGEQGEKVYGLKALYDAGIKYREAITKPTIEGKLEAAKYAKDISIAHKNIQELLTLIEKYMPVSIDNLSVPGNVDSLRTVDMPPQYRLDYIRVSHLANLYSLANLIESKGWNIDDFIERPMYYLKDYYKNDYLNKVDPDIINEGLTGNDLIFNIGRIHISNDIDNMPLGGGRIVEELACAEKDIEIRNNNSATYKAFNDAIFGPYNIANSFRENIANDDNLDKIIINPNLTYKDLGITKYDGDNLVFIESKSPNFDEINYIKNNNESIKEFKDRIDESILAYMQKEIALIKETGKKGVMYLTSEKYVDLVQKAVLKELIVKRNEKDDPTYIALQSLINNKKDYVTNLVNSIEDNEKYFKYNDVKNIDDHPITLEDGIYKPTNFEGQNKYRDYIDTYDAFINTAKLITNNEMSDFIVGQRNINKNLKNAYNAYNNALNKYNNEIVKTYGRNYNGEVNNLGNKKLLDAFVNKNLLLNKLNELKTKALDSIEHSVNEGKIPLSYYEDRQLQLDNNIFNNIPPLFRSDNQYNMDEYIKLKHPNDYQNLNNDEKEIIYNSYMKNYIKMENDFFSRKYLVSRQLTKKIPENFVIQKFESILNDKNLNSKALEAELYGANDEFIEENHIGEEDSLFDEIKYLREENISLNNFKNNLDKYLLDSIKEYNSALKNKEELNELPRIENLIDTYQKSTAKYLLVVADKDKSNPLYNDIKNFLLDSKSYINNLIDEENLKIDERNRATLESRVEEITNNQNNAFLNFNELENKLEFSMKDFKIDDNNVNKYTNLIEEFNKYYNDNKNDTNLVYDVKDKEDTYNENLEEEYHRYKVYNFASRAQDKFNNVDPNANYDDIPQKYINLGAKINEEDFKHERKTSKVMLDNLKTKAKIHLCRFYRTGLITQYYFEERFKRLDNNDFSLPNLYEINEIPPMEEYVKNKYPNEFATLTKDEKNEIYNRYKDACEEDRRQFLLNKYLISKGIKEFVKPTCPTFEAYKAEYDRLKDQDLEAYNNLKDKRENDLNIFEEKGKVLKENLEQLDKANINLDKSFIDEKEILPDFGLIDEIAKEEDEDMIEAHMENLEFKGQFDEMEAYQDNREYIAGIIGDEKVIDPFEKWVDNLKDLIKNKIGDIAYNLRNIDEFLTYNPTKDSFVYWIDDKRAQLENIFGKNLAPVFKQAIDNLDSNTKENLEEEIRKIPEEHKCFPDYFRVRIVDGEEIVTAITKEEMEAIEDPFVKKVHDDIYKENIEIDEVDNYIDDIFNDKNLINK